MHFLTVVFFYLALAVSDTFARLPLPDGYWITAVTDFGPDKTSESRGNPHAPLLNATLKCYSENHVTLLWRNYDLWGMGWYGVSEESIKFAAANANACITRWKFESWNDTGCFQNDDGSTDCAENMPMWHATFRHSQTVSSSELLTLNFEKLAGQWSRRWRSMVGWTMTNGTHERTSNLTEAYPPHGHMFRGACQWVDL